MVNTYSLFFTAAAVLAVSIPAFANPEEGSDAVSLVSREEDAQLYSRAPETDEATELYARSGSSSRYKSAAAKSLDRACKKIGGNDRKKCRKELDDIEKSKKSSKTADLKKAASKWRKQALADRKSAKQYRKSIHRLSHVCKTFKGKAKKSERKECFKELREIKKSKQSKKDKNVKLTTSLRKFRTSRKTSKEYKKQLKSLRTACKKSSDKKACLKEYERIRKSKDKKDKKLARIKKAELKYHAKRDFDEVDARSFDEDIEARDAASLNELD